MITIGKKYTFSQLLKESKKHSSELPSYRLAILGDFATQHLATALKGTAHINHLTLEVFDADYDQILPQIIDTNSELYQFKPDAVLLCLCVEKLYSSWTGTPEQERADFAESAFSAIAQYWDQISQNCKATILQFTFVENDDFVLGSYACKYERSFTYQLRKLNLLLMNGCIEYKNVFLIDLCCIQSTVGRDVFFDPTLYYVAKIPISLTVLPLVASRAMDVIQSLRGVVKKCVVLDLDNTLWGGIIGDDGLSGIQIGELGLGHAFSEFQSWLKELKKRGIVLAVCSKNEEATAKEPFEKHPDMILRLEDFSAFVANWENKAANIQHIQESLAIGMDSLVFIDDNPFERNVVRSLIPDITVPELPEDPARYLSYLKSLNLFETSSFSEADGMRTDQYRAEFQRKTMMQQFANFDEYLQSLEMLATAAPFDEFHTPRIAQLTQRSNQFNLRTIRYTEAEIELVANNTEQITLYFTLKDKLADHGLISVVIMEKQDENTLFLDTWLMSCRVLKRGMEEFIINKIVATAQESGYSTIIGEYLKTPKNAMVANMYENLGFKRISDSCFKANIADFTYNKTCIKE